MLYFELSLKIKKQILKKMTMKNYTTFKKMMAAVFFLLLAYSGTCQTCSEPQAITSTLADKHNLNLQCNNGEQWILLWEQPVDSATTAIYYQEEFHNGEPWELISEPNLHLKNPGIMDIGSNDTLYFIFYEKVSEEHKDLYYIKRAADGGLSAPVMFAESSGDLEYIIEQDKIAWFADGFLYASHLDYYSGNFYFAEPDTISEGEIKSIMFLDDILFWIAGDEPEDTLFYAPWDWQNQTWEESVMIITGDEMTNLETTNNTSFPPGFPLFSFTFQQDDLWYINQCFLDNPYNFLFDTLDVTDVTPFDFDLYAQDVITKNDQDYLDAFCTAFTLPVNEYREIFIIDQNLGYEEPFQLSDLGTISKNTQLVMGENISYYGNWVYILWEAQVEGFWQFYYSRAPFYWGAIDEGVSEESISITPNPATDFIRIQNKKGTDLTIEIFDLSGKRIYQNSFNQLENEIITTGWNSGVYFVNIYNKDSNFTRKIILN